MSDVRFEPLVKGLLWRALYAVGRCVVLHAFYPSITSPIVTRSTRARPHTCTRDTHESSQCLHSLSASACLLYPLIPLLNLHKAFGRHLHVGKCGVQLAGRLRAEEMLVHLLVCRRLPTRLATTLAPRPRTCPRRPPINLLVKRRVYVLRAIDSCRPYEYVKNGILVYATLPPLDPSTQNLVPSLSPPPPPAQSHERPITLQTPSVQFPNHSKHYPSQFASHLATTVHTTHHTHTTIHTTLNQQYRAGTRVSFPHQGEDSAGPGLSSASRSIGRDG